MDEDGNEGELEQVLRHELAHVNRRDDWGNLWQQIIEAGLFFHPAVWWISRRLSLEREIACDDLVLEASGPARGYALTLANAASRLRFHRDLAAPGVSGKNSQLQQRIDMILNTQRDRTSRLAKRWPGFFTAAAAGIAALAIMGGPRLVLADPTPAPDEASATTTTPADNTPAALPGDSATESGPRTKSSAWDSVAPAAPTPPTPPTPAVTPVPPTPPEAPEPPEPPTPAAVAIAPDTMAPPAMALVAPGARSVVVANAELPPMAVVTTDETSDEAFQTDSDSQPRHKDSHLSVEERLDRLEKMLDELKAREDMKARHHMSSSNGTSQGSVDAKIRVQPDAQITVQPDMGAIKFDWVAKETDRAIAQAQRAAEAGQRAAEQGQRAAEQAMREMAKLNNGDMARWKLMQADGSRQQLEALRQARESLQSQVRSLDQQIRQLEKDRDRLDAQRDKDKDKDKDKNKGDSDKDQAPDKE